MKVPPPALLMQVSNDPSPDHYRDVGHVQAAVEQPLNAAGYRLADFDRILDFGCGVGRLLQALNLSRREGQELCGCDVNEACATWCKENLDFAKVLHTALEPPLPYADDSFDLITAISVFTHLSRPLQVAWSRELMRILRPGGVAFITTCGLGILGDVIAVNSRWKSRELALLGATGNFYCFAVQDKRAFEGQREVIALHSREATVRIFSPLHLAFHAAIAAVAAGQDASVFVKPQGGCSVIVPVDSAVAAQGATGAIPANGRVSNIATHRFEIGRADTARFRSYVAFSERRFDLAHLAVECRLRDAATAQTLAQGRFAFPSSVALGPHHFVPFSIDLPLPHSVVVELALVLRRAPWQPAPINLLWWDSHLEIDAGAQGPGDEIRAREGIRQAEAEMVRLDEPLVAFS